MVVWENEANGLRVILVLKIFNCIQIKIHQWYPIIESQSESRITQKKYLFLFSKRKKKKIPVFVLIVSYSDFALSGRVWIYPLYSLPLAADGKRIPSYPSHLTAKHIQLFQPLKWPVFQTPNHWVLLPIW